MDETAAPEEGGNANEYAWIDSYRRNLEVFKKDKYLKVMHIRTKEIFVNGSFEYKSETPLYSKANEITVFLRRKSSLKVSAGIEFRLFGKLEDLHFKKIQGFHYLVRTRNKKEEEEGRSDEIIITKFLNTTKEKYLKRFYDELKAEVKRFHFLNMKNRLLDTHVSDTEFDDLF